MHLLTTRQVQTATDGDYSDGSGLVLRVRGDSASWVFRFTSPAGNRREMGLGAANRSNPAIAGESLVSARDAAHAVCELLRAGKDPIDARATARGAAREARDASKAEASRERWTLARAARDYHERVIEPSRTDKHAAQWISSLENHVPPELWHSPLTEDDPPTLLSALLEVKPHERARNHDGDKLQETVQRLRQRLDAVYEDAIFHCRATTNPAAAIKRKLREASGKRVRGSHRAMALGVIVTAASLLFWRFKRAGWL